MTSIHTSHLSLYYKLFADAWSLNFQVSTEIGIYQTWHLYFTGGSDRNILNHFNFPKPEQVDLCIKRFSNISDVMTNNIDPEQTVP